MIAPVMGSAPLGPRFLLRFFMLMVSGNRNGCNGLPPLVASLGVPHCTISAISVPGKTTTNIRSRSNGYCATSRRSARRAGVSVGEVYVDFMQEQEYLPQ